MTALAPVAPRERIVTLDVLRGIALLGVLIGNTFWLYSARAWEHPPNTSRLDSVAQLGVALLVDGKAQALLTFLFGLGFAAQLLRAEERQEPIVGLYLRRLVVLLAIGVLHVMLWWGDVTWTYALAGFGLLLFQRASTRARVVWAAVLTLIPSAILTLPAVRAAVGGLVGAAGNRTHAAQMMSAALHGDRFRPVIAAHLRFAIFWETGIFLAYFPGLLGRFLLGYVVGLRRWFDGDCAGRLELFRKLLVYGLAAFVLSAAFNVLLLSGVLAGHKPTFATKPGAPALVITSILEQLAILGMTAAYVGTLVLLMQRSSWRRLLAIMAPVGRMPLTTYISQSLICTAVFYGWGLGWAGRVHAAGCVGIALAIFAVQLIASHAWLRRFRFGPLEWSWRLLVYLRPPPMLARAGTT